MPRFTSTISSSYHTFVCTLYLEAIYGPQKPPFTLCSGRPRRPILIAFSSTLILLLLSSSGDIEVNPGPASPIPQALSFDDFCNRNSLGFMHVNIRSLLPKFVLFTALAHSAHPDVLAVSESWLRKTTKNSEISIPNYNIFRQDGTAKGGCVAIYCRDSLQSSVLLSRSARPSSITTLDSSDLEYVDNYKYLGVWLDCKLSFQTHIKHLQS